MDQAKKFPLNIDVGRARSQMKKLNVLFLVVFVAAGLAAAAWSAIGPRPRISFLGFREAPQGRVAIFMITNSSTEEFTFTGSRLDMPDYRYRATGTSGSSGWGFRLFSIRPHSAIKFEAVPPSPRPFRVGVRFERGSRDDYMRRGQGLESSVRGWLAIHLHWAAPRFGWVWSNQTDAKQVPLPNYRVQATPVCACCLFLRQGPGAPDAER